MRKSEAERLEDSVVGGYELKFDDENISKLVLLENGKGEIYIYGEKEDDGTRRMVGR